MSNSNAIRMGRAFVEFFGDASPLGRSIAQVKEGLSSLGQFAVKAGASLAAVGGSVLAPLTSFFTQAAERGRDMQGLADQFGMTVESISGLAGGFEAAGVPFEQFSGILDNLSHKLLENDELLRQFGLSTGVLSRIPIDQQLEQIAGAFQQMTNPMQRAQLAQELFGSEWRKLMPYLKEGAAGIRKLKEEGKDLAMDPETARRGTEVMKGLNQVWAQFKHTLIDVGSALLPNMESVRATVGWLKSAGKSIREWIVANKETIKVVAVVAAGLVGAGLALTAFGTAALAASAAIGGAISIITGLVSVITTTFSVVSGLAGFLLTLPGLLAAAAVAIGAYFIIQTGAGRAALDTMKEGFVGLKETAISAWEGIGAALTKGDFALAFQIASVAIQLAWKQMLAAMDDSWATFVDHLAGGGTEGGGMGRVLSGAIAGWKLLWIDFVGFVWKQWAWVLRNIQEAMAQTAEALNKLNPSSGDESEIAKSIRSVHIDTDEEADARRNRAKDKVINEDRDTAAAAKAGREERKKPDRSEIVRLSDLLNELKKKAVEGKEGELGGGGDFEQKTPDRDQVMGLAKSVKGGFIGAAAAQQFGVGDKTDRVIDGLNNLGTKLDKLPTKDDWREYINANRVR
jgi:hypothetical protein